jgi:hypothetical protein
MGDHVFLKIRSKKGVIKFGKKRRLSTHRVGPFWHRGRVTFHLALQQQIDREHKVFHMSIASPFTTHLLCFSFTNKYLVF